MPCPFLKTDQFSSSKSSKAAENDFEDERTLSQNLMRAIQKEYRYSAGRGKSYIDRKKLTMACCM